MGIHERFKGIILVGCEFIFVVIEVSHQFIFIVSFEYILFEFIEGIFLFL